MMESEKIVKNQTAKTRMAVEGWGAIDSPINFSVGQKISVLGKKLKIKSCEKAKNQASCRIHFGIYPINIGSNEFDIFYFKILKFIFFFFGLATQKRRKQNQKKKKRRLRFALTVNFGLGLYGKRDGLRLRKFSGVSLNSSSRVCRFDTPHGLAQC